MRERFDLEHTLDLRYRECCGVPVSLGVSILGVILLKVER
jgi:hypothetical protein